MTQDWMIDVLNDLQTFAKANGFGRLAEQLDDAIHIAALDIAADTRGEGMREVIDGSRSASLHRSARTC